MRAALCQHKWVWLDHEKHVFLPVQMEENHGDSYLVVSAHGEKFKVSADQECTEVHPTSLQPCEDMVRFILFFRSRARASVAFVVSNRLCSWACLAWQVKLAELSEGAILHNLRMRYVANDIYVRLTRLSAYLLNYTWCLPFLSCVCALVVRGSGDDVVPKCADGEIVH